MTNAEYEKLDAGDGELDLVDTDSLPWLESDEEEDGAGGLDTGQILVFAAALVLVLGAAVGGVWYFANRADGTATVADGSVIAAPEGPIKEKPAEAGGKEFAGTGNVAPMVGEGGSRSAVVAEKPVPVSMAPTKPTPIAGGAPVPASAAQGVGVQLAAYGTRARAEEGWGDLSRRTALLSGVTYRVVEGKVDIGTVYRLQAVAANRAEAERLCAALKAEGVDCQVK